MVFRGVVVTDAFVHRDIVGIPVKTLKVTHVPNEFHFMENLSMVLKYIHGIHAWIKTVCTVTELIKIIFLRSTLILTKGWFPYDRGSQIADRNKVCDRLRSYGNQPLERTWFYLLRSSAITIAGSQTIAEVVSI